MTAGIPLHLAVEDVLQEVILRRILAQIGGGFEVGVCYKRGGFGYLRKNIGGFNQAARGTPFLVLTDLDRAPCPSRLIEDWLPQPRHPNLVFRVAVRAVESWIMAHRDAFSRFVEIRVEEIPDQVDTIEHPKRFLVNLARGARRRSIREGIVPAVGSTAQIGPEYNSYLVEFLQESWSVDTARLASRSLDRLVSVLSRFTPV